MVSYEVIGRHIKEARLRLELSQAEVAFRIGKSTAYYGKIERGAIRPNIDRLAELSQALGIPFECLFKGTFIPEEIPFDNVPPVAEEFEVFLCEIGKKVNSRTKTIIMRICAELTKI